MIKFKSPEYSCLCICNIDAQFIDWICDWPKLFFNRTRRTPQQDMKSNNTAQDGEQHNAILRW